MTEEVAKIKANKDGTYIDIVPEKCVSAQKAQYDENGRDLLDAESSQTIKGANTYAAKQTFTGGVAVSGTSAIAGNVNMDSGDLAIGAKVTASNTGNSIKVANHDTALISNDVLSAKDINTPNGDANILVHREGNEPINGVKTFEYCPFLYSGGAKSSAWNEVFRVNNLTSVLKTVTCLASINGAIPTCGLVRFGVSANSIAVSVGGLSADIFCATINADGTSSLWINASRFNVLALDVVLANRGNNLSNSDYSVGTIGLSGMPAIGDEYIKVTEGKSMW